MKFGELIKEKRKSKNLTLKNVSDLIGVSESLISRYESNENEPSLTKGIKLMKVLEITFEEVENCSKE